VSPEATGTNSTRGVPPSMSADVRVTLALPEEVIVPTAVAVSTCATLTREPTVVFVEDNARVRPAAVAVCVGLSQSRENAAYEVRARQVFMG